MALKNNIDDFDNENNFIKQSVPTILSRCFKKNAVGLWISNENLDCSGWRKRCTDECQHSCDLHYEDIKKISLITKDGSEVEGGLIINPRICIIRKTNMIKLNANTNRFEGIWKKGDGEKLDDITKKKKYIFAFKFIMVFLDKQNKKLHETPIQLTARGVFAIEFSKQYELFKNEFSKVYCTVTGKRSSRMCDEWYARCIFSPIFEMKMVGRPGTQTNACVTTGFENPTENNWEKLCTRGDIETSKFILEQFSQYEEWNNKFSYKRQNNFSSPSSSSSMFEEDFD